jgi:G3E family GTPase
LYSPSRPLSPLASTLLTAATEFGDSAAIEKSLTINQSGQAVEEWISLANGCICCSVKDSGVAALESLMERQGAFDYILLETTGLADPGNIAPIFWVDEGLGSSIYLDGIVTVVDAVNVVQRLEEPAKDEEVADEAQQDEKALHPHSQGPILTTAHLQISHADILLLNKCDLVSPAELQTITSRIRAINGLAHILPTTHGRVPQLEGHILDLHAYDAFSTIPDFTAKGHSHLDPSISTRRFDLPHLHPHCLPILETWLRAVLWRESRRDDNNDSSTPPADVHRVKGLLRFTNGSTKILQGVREIFDIIDSRQDVPCEEVDGGGRIVMIGRRLDSIDMPVLD